MCYDPWDETVYEFANLYLNAVKESTNPTRTDSFRHAWAGKAEMFEKYYPEKLEELDDAELDEWLGEIETDFNGEERLLEPAEKELKRRAEESTDART